MKEIKDLLKKWQDIQNAMNKIAIENQSRYFNDFRIEVENRIHEYKFLINKMENV